MEEKNMQQLAHRRSDRGSASSRLSTWFIALAWTALIAACGGGSEPSAGADGSTSPAQGTQAAAAAAAVAPAGFEPVLAAHALGRANLQAPTGATYRDFSVFVDTAELLPPYAMSTGQVLRVQPVSTGALVSVVHWGDGEYTVINGGWNSSSPPLTHAYETPGTYRVEYATQDPSGQPFQGWDSRVLTVTVSAGETTPPGAAFTRDFGIVSNGQALPAPPTVAVNQPVTIVPASENARTSVIYWGDGTYTVIDGGWKPTTPTSLTTRSYATPGTYRIEYATLSPRGSWDSKIVTLTVDQPPPPPPPPPPPAAFVRDFTVTSNGQTLSAPISVPVNQPINIVPASALALTSVIYWGDGTYTLINGGWRASTPADVTSRIYSTPGTYRIEYATLSPAGVWDSRVIGIEVGGPPPGPPGSFTRGFSLSSGGVTLTAPVTVAVDTIVRLTPASNLARRSVIYWGDGSLQEIPDGWRTSTPEVFMTHRYAAAGTYRIEYATLSPEGSWDSRTASVSVTGAPPPPPPPPPASPNAIKLFAIGSNANTCVTFQDDRVRCWGAFASWPEVPASIPGVTALAIASEANAVCAVAGGRVTCYGNAQLSAAFSTVADVKELRLGSSPCALTGTGLLRCFTRAGNAYFDDTGLRFDFPVASFVESGGMVCAVSTTGRLSCRQSGREVPPAVPSAIEDAVSVTWPGGQPCVVRRSGAVVCFSFDAFNPPSQSPSDLVDGIQVAKYEISREVLEPLPGSIGVTCALRRTGNVVCWDGNQRFVEAGDGLSTLTGIVQVKSDSRRLCALSASGVLRCFSASYPFDPYGAGPEVFNVAGVRAVGADCAVGRDGAAHCWGRQYLRDGGTFATLPQLGERQMLFAALPFIDVKSLAYAPSRFFLEPASACALSDRGTLACWGGGVLETTLPAELGTRSVSTLISLFDRACALTTDGVLRCWGGDNRSVEQQLAAEVAALSGVRQIVSHRDGAGQGLCALLSQGQMTCWATNVNALEDSIVRSTLAGPFTKVFAPGCGELSTGGVRCTEYLGFLGLEAWFSQLPGLITDVSAEAPWFSSPPIYATTSNGQVHAYALLRSSAQPLPSAGAGRQVTRVVGNCIVFSDGSASCDAGLDGGQYVMTFKP
jgi:hypothetical protein